MGQTSRPLLFRLGWQQDFITVANSFRTSA